MSRWVIEVLSGILVFLIGGAISAVLWVTSTYATSSTVDATKREIIEYIDKGRADDRAMLKEVRDDMKQVLERLPRR